MVSKLVWVPYGTWSHLGPQIKPQINPKSKANAIALEMTMRHLEPAGALD